MTDRHWLSACGEARRGAEDCTVQRRRVKTGDEGEAEFGGGCKIANFHRSVQTFEF